MRCPSCGEDEKIELWCSACGDWIGDPESGMEDYALAMEILAGVYTKEELAGFSTRASSITVQNQHDA